VVARQDVKGSVGGPCVDPAPLCRSLSGKQHQVITGVAIVTWGGCEGDRGVEGRGHRGHRRSGVTAWAGSRPVGRHPLCAGLGLPVRGGTSCLVAMTGNPVPDR
jgi:hypothetical protein